MIRMNTDIGQITVDSAVYTNIAGFAATNCFGVKGRAVRSMTDGLRCFPCAAPQAESIVAV